MKTFQKLRQERGLTVEAVERVAGLPHNSLVGIESGVHKSPHGLYCLANFFGVKLDKFILIEYGIIEKHNGYNSK